MAIDERSIERISLSASIPLGQVEYVFPAFFDLCGSTDFKSYCQSHRIPDGVWIERQLIFLHRIITTVQRFQGHVVKTIGDEVMAYFPKTIKARDILRCATDAHSLFSNISRYDNETWRIRLKVSIDYGPVYDENFGLIGPGSIDPVGLVVDRCARLNHEAQPNEVTFSSSVFAQLDADHQLTHSRSKEEKELKGVGATEFYRILVGIPNIGAA